MGMYPIDISVQPEVKTFFDPATNTISYVVKDPSSHACAVIDSAMDIDYEAGRITYQHADEIIDYIRSNNLKLEWIIETHVHAGSRICACCRGSIRLQHSNFQRFKRSELAYKTRKQNLGLERSARRCCF